MRRQSVGQARRSPSQHHDPAFARPNGNAILMAAPDPRTATRPLFGFALEAKLEEVGDLLSSHGVRAEVQPVYRDPSGGPYSSEVSVPFWHAGDVIDCLVFPAWGAHGPVAFNEVEQEIGEEVDGFLRDLDRNPIESASQHPRCTRWTWYDRIGAATSRRNSGTRSETSTPWCDPRPGRMAILDRCCRSGPELG